MKVPESVLWAIKDALELYEELDCSHIRFYCEDEDKNKAAACFKAVFLQEDSDGHVGSCRTSITNDGFVAYCSDTYYDDEANDLGIIPRVDGDPRGRAIEAVKEMIPGICYRGLDCLFESDRWSGDMIWDEYGEGMPAPLAYDTVGETLSHVLNRDNEESEFWELVGKNKEEPGCLDEYLERYDQFDSFWGKLAEQMFNMKKRVAVNSFPEILEFFQAYSKWIKGDTIEKFLQLVEAYDPAIREALEGEAF